MESHESRVERYRSTLTPQQIEASYERYGDLYEGTEDALAQLQDLQAQHPIATDIVPWDNALTNLETCLERFEAVLNALVDAGKEPANNA